MATSKTILTGILALAASLFLMAPLSSVQAHKNHNIEESAHPATKARHTLMTNAAFATKMAGAMVKKQAPYDPAQAELAMRMIDTTALTMENYFPDASKPAQGSKSEAAPTIWSDMEGFLKEIEKYKAATRAAVKVASKGENEFKAGFISVIKSCKSCHETYRIKKQ